MSGLSALQAGGQGFESPHLHHSFEVKLTQLVHLDTVMMSVLFTPKWAQEQEVNIRTFKSR